MTGGGTSGAVTLNVIGGDGITANADDIAVDLTTQQYLQAQIQQVESQLEMVSGNFAANIITGTATAARYADLAENYLADKSYEPRYSCCYRRKCRSYRSNKTKQSQQ